MGRYVTAPRSQINHAIVNAGKADISELSGGECKILKLVSRGLLCAVSGAHQYVETAVTLECGGFSFAAKGKTVLTSGWKAYMQEQADKPLPELSDGQAVCIAAVSIMEGKTSPPSHFDVLERVVDDAFNPKSSGCPS